MRWLFDIDNPVMRYAVKIFDCIWLSMLWMVCCLPVITVGVSTTALYGTIYHYIRKEEGGMLSTFWRQLKENWKQSTLLWLVVLGVLALLSVDALVFRTFAINGALLGKLYWLILLLIALTLTWTAYLFAYAARFQGSVGQILKISLQLMLLHPIKSFFVFLPVFFGLIIGTSAPGLLTIVPAAACWIGSYFTEEVFSQHLSQEDEEVQA